jgi:uncharacterized RDD family membrane protein YckC
MMPSEAYAGAVSRLAAYVLDLAVLSVLLSAGSAIVAYLVAIITGQDVDLTADRWVAALWWTGGWFVYFAGSWAITGQTAGMALFGIRVVRPDGTAASTRSAVIRTLAFPLSVALFGLGFVGIVFQAQRRALHDLIAGTAVVYSPPPTAEQPVVTAGE